MDSSEEFENGWELLVQSGVWSGNDLQLAAELGKTLLERNKELENCIKIHQCTIEDQAQEIEYMKKQTAALREVNDSRLKIYEQLEVSIQDLERANQRLALENANDKKQIKSQCSTIDALETRIDDLQKKLDALTTKYEAILREHTKNQSTDSTHLGARTEPRRDGSTQNLAASPRRFSPDEEARLQQLASEMSKDEDVTKLLKQLQEAKYQRSREQKRVEQLKEQLDTLLHEHAQMEEQLNLWKAKAQDMKNLQDEINTLEEVRQGNLCGRCLRGTDPRAQDELSVMLDQEEEVDELSLAESLPESLRDCTDSSFQDLTTSCSNVSTNGHSNFTSFIWKKMSCIWSTPSLLISVKFGLFSPLSMFNPFGLFGFLGLFDESSKCSHNHGGLMKIFNPFNWFGLLKWFNPFHWFGLVKRFSPLRLLKPLNPLRLTCSWLTKPLSLCKPSSLFNTLALFNPLSLVNRFNPFIIVSKFISKLIKIFFSPVTWAKKTFVPQRIVMSAFPNSHVFSMKKTRD